MIRPIDTQILYPNSPTLSNRQQVDNQKPNMQQEQFAQMMQKEVLEKRDKIMGTEEGQKVGDATDEKGQNKKHANKGNKDQKRKANKQIDLPEGDGQSRFDIRI